MARSASLSILPSTIIVRGRPSTNALKRLLSRVNRDIAQCTAMRQATAAILLSKGALPVIPRLAIEPIVITITTASAVGLLSDLFFLNRTISISAR